MSKRKEHRVAFARTEERAPVAKAPAPTAGYPSVASLLESSELGSIVRRTLALAAAAGLATAAVGCVTPECQATRLGEVTAHSGYAVDNVADLQIRSALSEVGVAIGIVPHPSIAMAGAMPPVTMPPVPPPTVTPPPSPEPADPPSAAQ